MNFELFWSCIRYPTRLGNGSSMGPIVSNTFSTFISHLHYHLVLWVWFCLLLLGLQFDVTIFFIFVIYISDLMKMITHCLLGWACCDKTQCRGDYKEVVSWYSLILYQLVMPDIVNIVSFIFFHLPLSRRYALFIASS